jgi:predicted GH43/DUF377 family glycosyl hydrolase
MKAIGKVLVKPADIRPSFSGWSVACVFNPAAARMSNGRIVLLARVAERPPAAKSGKFRCPEIVKAQGYKAKCNEVARGEVRSKNKACIRLWDKRFMLTTLSHFRRIVLSKDGFEVEEIADSPSFTGTVEEGQYGVEDPRITRIGGKYVMTYVSVSRNEGISTSLALSKDLRNWKRQGIIFSQQNKDAVIFPEKIAGKYVALHRPEGFFGSNKPSIWVSYSPDLVFWGREKSILHCREQGWDSERIGAGAAPVKTKGGWLEIYHGVRKEGKKKIYGAGAVLLDLRNPEKVLARTPKKEPLFEPKHGFEKRGFTSNVVFPTGAVPDQKGKDLLVFYGAADTVVAVKKLALKEVLNSLQYY